MKFYSGQMCFKTRFKWAVLVSLLLAPLALQAETYFTPQQFLDNSFGVNKPQLQTLWMTKDVAAQVENILGHAYKQARVRYWKSASQSAWILDEIGKKEPITAGFLVESGQLKQVTVLAYWESRGGEVRHPNFLKQYQGANLQADYQLNKTIDGISGATLSVRAMGRMARLALYFEHISHADQTQTDLH